VRLLLDEMIGAVVAEQLRDRGHDVVAVQDPDRGHLRGLDDCLLLATADDESRAVVTDNIPDFFRCHQRRIDDGLSHHGLLFFTNDSFPRYRHDLFVGQAIAALERELAAHEKDDPSGWIRWLMADR
jgi:nucleoside-diphosphate-sugar epimerase